MPTVLRSDGFRLFFYSLENHEPPHIHIERGDETAKFWLNPVVLAMNNGFRSHELTRLRELVTANRDILEKAWHVHFGDQI